MAGVEALLVGVFHASKDTSAAEAHWVDGTLIMEQHSVCDDLERSQKFAFSKVHVVVSGQLLQRLYFAHIFWYYVLNIDSFKHSSALLTGVSVVTARGQEHE